VDADVEPPLPLVDDDAAPEPPLPLDAPSSEHPDASVRKVERARAERARERTIA
jgi:hypothetical protein